MKLTVVTAKRFTSVIPNLLTQLINFVSIKFYCLITLISPIAQFLPLHKFYCFCIVHIFHINTRDINIYVAHWWEKYLFKSSFIKHTFSWHDTLLVLAMAFFIRNCNGYQASEMNIPTIMKNGYCYSRAPQKHIT